MAQVDGFSRIAVTAAEDDEVIQAGAVSSAQDAPLFDGKPVPRDEPVGCGPMVVQPVPPLQASASGGSARSDREEPVCGEGAWEDPTLDDLKGAPLPLAQKIVIIAAIALIFAAVGYYIIFMR